MSGRVISGRGLRGLILPDVIPLIAAVAVGVGYGLYTIYHHVTSNPEVRISPTERSMAPWENAHREEVGAAWAKGAATGYRHRDNDIGHLSAVQAASSRYWQQRFAVWADPEHNTKSGPARF